MYNFYPGPSKLDARTAQYFQEAVDSGILERNHRSEPFRQLYKETLAQFQQKLNVPATYKLVFISSATEAWEIITQSLTEKGSLHFYNGAFGEKWFNYAHKVNSKSAAQKFNINTTPEITSENELYDVLAFTHNETSNGTQLPLTFMQKVRAAGSQQLIAYDVTSSMAGQNLDWLVGDIWFASVQKCFGLPSGLGVLLLSPKAVERAKKIEDRAHYNAALFMLENAEKWQTHYTPNIAHIFMMNRLLEDRENIQSIERNIN